MSSNKGNQSRSVGWFFALPFLGGLNRLSPKHFRGAGVEVCVTVLLATFPMWAGAFYGALSESGNITTFGQAVSLYFSKLRATLDNGTLILYSASLIAPVLYLALEIKRRHEEEQSMPSPMAHILTVFFIQTAATIYFTKQMSSESINPGFAFYASVVMFVMTVLVLFVVYCHRHFDTSVDPVYEMDQEAERFVSGYSRHRGDK